MRSTCRTPLRFKGVCVYVCVDVCVCEDARPGKMKAGYITEPPSPQSRAPAVQAAHHRHMRRAASKATKLSEVTSSKNNDPHIPPFFFFIKIKVPPPKTDPIKACGRSFQVVQHNASLPCPQTEVGYQLLCFLWGIAGIYQNANYLRNIKNSFLAL